jgi:ferrous iron transport protein B
MFAPLGLDWKFTVAILMSFLAREVFVGALGTMMGLEDNGTDETMEDGLVARLQSSDMPLGTSIGLLVFYVFAMQCVSTLAVLKQEVGNVKTPILIFIGYNVLAYLLALFCVWGLG